MLRIALDAGHGGFGITPGKRSPDGSMYEWDFNNAVLEFMQEELAHYENVQILIVSDPTGKRDIPLEDRTDKANQWGADVYVSLHANAYKGIMGNHTGIETYVYPSKPKEAYELAMIVQNNLTRNTQLKNRGIKTADFHVLRQTKMTAILIEHGFMDSTIDLPNLKKESFRKKCALANVQSLVQFYKLQRKTVKKTKGLYKVQAGAFVKRENAEKLARQLKSHGFDSYIVEE